MRPLALPWLPLLAVPLVTGRLTAAVTVKLESATTLSVKVHDQVRTVPANRDISKGASLYLSAPGHHAAFDATLTGSKLRVAENGRGQGVFVLPNTRVGRHSMRLTLTADPPLTGRLDVRMKWSGYRAAGLGQVQVGKNLLQVFPPLIPRAERSFPVVVDKNGLTVTTTTERYTSTASIYPGWFSFSLEVEFVPGLPCGASPYGPACGAKLAATLLRHDLTLDLTETFPDAPGFLVIGFERDGLRVPSTPCSLLLKIAWLGGFRTDTRGNARFRLALPSGVPLYLCAHTATLAVQSGRLMLEMTNGIAVGCP